jgi:hypothetical protein
VRPQDGKAVCGFQASIETYFSAGNESGACNNSQNEMFLSMKTACLKQLGEATDAKD